MKRRRYDGKSLFEVCHSFHCVAAPVGEGTLFMFVKSNIFLHGKIYIMQLYIVFVETTNAWFYVEVPVAFKYR